MPPLPFVKTSPMWKGALMFKWMKKLLTAALAALVVFMLCPAFAVGDVLPHSMAASAPEALSATKAYAGSVSVSGTDSYARAYEVLDIVNQERAKEGLPALTMDADLLEAAMQRAAELTVYYSHTRPTGESCFTASEKMYGENIAAWYQNASSVMDGWMNSEGHRANILRSGYTIIGVGCFVHEGRSYWVQCFGYDDAEPAVKPADATVEHTVNLQPSELELSFIAISDFDSPELEVGQTDHLDIYSDMDWSNAHLLSKSFVWTSSDERVATVDQTGTVTFKGGGDVTITATIKGSDQAVSYSYHINAPVHAPGWAYENGGYYYYEDDGTLRTDAFMLLEGKYYYLGADGRLVTGGWVQHKGVAYYIDSDWSLALDRWVRYGGKYYYFGSDAQLVVGAWKQFGGKSYYFASDGHLMVDEWFSYGGKWYYFDKSAQIATDMWFNSGNDWYYIAKDGHLCANEWVDYYGYNCHFNASGVCDDVAAA